MINKKILLETEIIDFIVNDRPATNNIATWIMQLYELEFKFNTIRYYPNFFENVPGVNLDEIKAKLSHIINVISKSFITTIYYVYQSWYNYHNYFNSMQEMISRYSTTNSIRDKLTDENFRNMVGKLGRLTQEEEKYTFDLDQKVIYEYVKDDIMGLSNFSDFSTRVDIYSMRDDTNEFMYELQMLVDSNLVEEFYKAFSPSLQINKFIEYVQSDESFPVNKKERQYNLLYKYIKKLFEVNSNHMETELSQYSSGLDPSSVLIRMEQQVKEQYYILTAINRISQHQLLIRSNLLLHKVHYTGNMANYLPKIKQGLWFNSEFTKIYPYNINEVQDQNIIDDIIKRKLTFIPREQVMPSLRNIQNMFQDKTKQKEYLNQNYGAFVSGHYIEQTSFFNFLSNLPKPELRQWGKELNQYGLDKHFHMLMNI